MKHLSTCLITWLLVAQVFGQNNLFLPFGQSPEEVRTFLNSRDYIQGVEEDREMLSLRARLDEHKQVEYVFDEQGVLYATTVTRNYQSRRDADDIQDEVLEYMDIVSQGQIRKTVDDNITCYTALADSRVIKLFVIELQDSRTLTLTSISRQHGPALTEEDLYYENDLLQRRFISN